MKAKVIIEMEGKDEPIVIELEEFEMSMKQKIKIGEDKNYSLGDKYAVIHGWITRRVWVDHKESER